MSSMVYTRKLDNDTVGGFDASLLDDLLSLYRHIQQWINKNLIQTHTHTHTHLAISCNNQSPMELRMPHLNKYVCIVIFSSSHGSKKYSVSVQPFIIYSVFVRVVYIIKTSF